MLPHQTEIAHAGQKSTHPVHGYSPVKMKAPTVVDNRGHDPGEVAPRYRLSTIAHQPAWMQEVAIIGGTHDSLNELLSMVQLPYLMNGCQQSILPSRRAESALAMHANLECQRSQI